MSQSIGLACRTDVLAIATLHSAAFPDTFMTALGHTFLAAYYKSLTRSPTGLVCVSQGRAGLIGFAAGDTQAERMYADLVRSRLKLGLSATPALVRHPRLVRRLLRAFGNARGRAEPVEAGVAELSSLAVHPRSQGCGVGGRLLEHFCLRATDVGARCVRVRTPAQENDAVLAFYRAHCFEEGTTYMDGPSRRMLELVRSLD